MDKSWKLPPMDDVSRLAVIAALERSLQLEAKHEKELHERLTASAIAMGFSSLEEQRQHEEEEGERREAEFRQRVPEIAAAAGQTVEEFYRDLYSNKDLTPPSPVPSFSDCDCEGK